MFRVYRLSTIGCTSLSGHNIMYLRKHHSDASCCESETGLASRKHHCGRATNLLLHSFQKLTFFNSVRVGWRLTLYPTFRGSLSGGAHVMSRGAGRRDEAQSWGLFFFFKFLLVELYWIAYYDLIKLSVDSRSRTAAQMAYQVKIVWMLSNL
jgi:hypothetical protein